MPEKSNHPLGSTRGCTTLPVDKNSTDQKDQCSVKNLDSEGFHLRLKNILNIQSINKSSTKTFKPRKKRTKKIHTYKIKLYNSSRM